MVGCVPDKRSRHQCDCLQPQGRMYNHKLLEILAQSADVNVN